MHQETLVGAGYHKPCSCSVLLSHDTDPPFPYDTGYNVVADHQRAPPSRLDQLTKGHVERERQVTSALERATSAFEAEKKNYLDDWKKQMDSMRTKSTSMERARAKRAEGDEKARRALADRAAKSYESLASRSETAFQAATTRALEDLASCVLFEQSWHGTKRTTGKMDHDRPSRVFAKVLDTIRVELQLPKHDFPGPGGTQSGVGVDSGLSGSGPSPTARRNSQASSCVLLESHSGANGNIENPGVQMQPLANSSDYREFLDSTIQRWAQHLEDERAGFSKAFSSILKSVSYQSLGDAPDNALAVALSEFRAAERMRNAEAVAEFKKVAFSFDLAAMRVLDSLRRAEWKISLRPAAVTSSAIPGAGNPGVQIRSPHEPYQHWDGLSRQVVAPPQGVLPIGLPVGPIVPPTWLPGRVPEVEIPSPLRQFPRSWSPESVHVDVHPVPRPMPSLTLGVYHNAYNSNEVVVTPPIPIAVGLPPDEQLAQAQDSAAESGDDAAVAFRGLRRQHEFNLILASWKRSVRTDVAEREAAYAEALIRAREEWLAEEKARDIQFSELSDQMNESFAEANEARGKVFIDTLRRTSDAFYCALDEAMFGMHQFVCNHCGNEGTES